MKDHGLKAVMNFRTSEDRHKKEQAFVKGIGLSYYHFPMDAQKRQDPARLREILDVIAAPENQPILIHCAAGKDRTGLVAALYKIEYLGVPKKDVIKEMIMYGFDLKAFPHLLAIIEAWPQQDYYERKIE